MKHILPITEVRAAIAALEEAFHGNRHHDLWDGSGRLQCSPVEAEWLQSIQQRGLDALGFDDLDYLMSCASLTIGSDNTVRYFTPRYLSALLAFPAYGWYAAGPIMRDRLERCEFDGWPRNQRQATAEALVLMGRAMILMADEFSDEVERDGVDLIDWGTAKRELALAEIAALKHKAGVKKPRHKPNSLRR